MGLDPASLIATIGGQALNMFQQEKTNFMNRSYNLQDYAKQRADSLADWNRQNEYNSPTQQMARLRAAGLNPNLINGQGATSAAATIHESQTTGTQAKAPQMDTGTVLQALAQAQLLNSQKDLLDAQKHNTTEQATGHALDNQFASDTYDDRARTVQQHMFTSESDAALSHDRWEYLTTVEWPLRAKQMAAQTSLNDQQVNQSIQAVENMKQQLRLMNQLEDLRKFEQRLHQLGLTPQDPFYLRSALKLFDAL